MRIQDWIGLTVLASFLAAVGCGGSDVKPPATNAAVAPPAEAETNDCRYRVSLHSTCTAKMPDGKSNEIDADASFQYTWRFRDNEAELLLHQIDDQTTLGSQPVIESTRSRQRFHARRGEEVLVDASFDTAEEPLRAMLRASFDSPLCKITLDEDGREVARKTTDAPGAKMVLDDGIIANTRLFHGPFPAGQTTWQAPTEISMGGGRFAGGTLTYTLIERPADSIAPQEHVAVHVTGELVGGSDDGPAGRDTVTYRFDGTQVYDRTLGRWISGEFDAQMTSEIGVGEEKIVATGTTKIEMAMIPDGNPPAQTAARPSSSIK